MKIIRSDQLPALAKLQKVLLDAKKELILLVPKYTEYLKEEAARTELIHAIHDAKVMITVITSDKVFASQCKRHHIEPITKYRDLKKIVKDHPESAEILHSFAPNVWQQSLKSRLQTAGLLSLPRVRVWGLLALCILAFLFVFFRLLPSATFSVWPVEDTYIHTTNIFLVGNSGSNVGDIPPRARVLPLIPLTIKTDVHFSSTDVSKKFTGSSATVTMTIINDSDEPTALRATSRLQNQAGMVFRLVDPVVLPAQSERNVLAKADEFDIFGEVIGERGNVPAGLKWEFPGLSNSLKQTIYAENRIDATGGASAFSSVIAAEDIELAKKVLKARLLREAIQGLEERQATMSTNGIVLEIMNRTSHDVLKNVEYSNISVAEEFIGQPMSSFPISGSITYTRFGFDKQAVLRELKDDIQNRNTTHSTLVTDSLTLDNTEYHVISFDDDLRWIKLTATMNAVERTNLDPLSPTGANFGQVVRTTTAGVTYDEALRIVKNLPEVKHAQLNLWPPWSQTIPAIPANIHIEPQRN